MSNNYSMIQGHNFVSPLRGATSAAVPHNKRDMSSSPYMQKKRSDVHFAAYFHCYYRYKNRVKHNKEIFLKMN